MSVVWRAAGAIAALTAGALLGVSLWFALADRVAGRYTRDALREAIRMSPDNWRFFIYWAESTPKDAVVALRGAATVNARNPGIPFELATRLEEAGQLDEAEKALKTAVELDKTLASRLGLADFYFRRHDAAKFWPGAREALQVAAAPPASLFEECWALSKDGAEIFRRAIPDRTLVLRAYLAYLLNQNRLENAAPVADRLMLRNDADETKEPLLSYCDRMAMSGATGPAVTTWNWLAARKLIPFEALRPEKGRSLTNGTFTSATTGRAFDWRSGAVFSERSAQGLVLSFDGKQPERCEVLSQYLPLLANGRYQLAVRYRTEGIAGDRASGLAWRLEVPDGSTVKDLLAGGGAVPAASQDSGERTYSFTASEPPAQPGWVMARLVLGYARALGTVRIEGTVNLRGVDLRLEAK